MLRLYEIQESPVSGGHSPMPAGLALWGGCRMAVSPDSLPKSKHHGPVPPQWTLSRTLATDIPDTNVHCHQMPAFSFHPLYKFSVHRSIDLSVESWRIKVFNPGSFMCSCHFYFSRKSGSAEEEEFAWEGAERRGCVTSWSPGKWWGQELT